MSVVSAHKNNITHIINGNSNNTNNLNNVNSNSNNSNSNASQVVVKKSQKKLL